MTMQSTLFKLLPGCFLSAAAILLCGICPVFGADLKVLPGHVPKAISSLAPKGRLAATNELRLAIGVPLRDRAGLDHFVAQVSDPASPNFRHFLTREELTARFGPTEQDYEAVKTFAGNNGLAITVTHSNRLLLDVTGPAAAVEKAFHITLRTYRHPTEARDFFAPDTEPMVDAALPVVDIQGLSDFSRPHPKFSRRPKQNAAKAVPRSGNAPDGSGDLFGNDFRNAYVPGVTLTGAGQSVGLVEFNGFFANDISNYAKLAGNGRTNIVIETVLLDNYNGRASTSLEGAEVEVELDIEMAMAIAPGLAKIISYEAGPYGIQNDVLNAMLANSNVLNLSCSWGWDGGPTSTTDAIFMSMDAVGQTFFNASGDSQAFTTGSSSVNGVDNPSLDNAPSSNPYITQVGGTTLTMNGLGASWASEVVWNWGGGTGSSGGISSYYPIPSWQTNVSNMAGRGGSASSRNIPDVAANADNVYVIYDNGKNTNDYDGWGGTSCAAPMWAGFMALVNQQSVANGGSNSGFINPAIYAIAAGSNYASCFHDVTSGNNTWSSSPNLFYAMANYDLCTGLGTMNGQSLINALAPSGTLVPMISNLAASQSITYGTSAIILGGKISAAGPVYPASGETVTVTINGNSQTTTIDDSTGDFSFNYNPHTIPASGAAYTITYSYAGDASLPPLTNTSTTLTVNRAALSVTASAQSKTYGQTVAFGSGSTLFTSSGLQNSETIGTVTLAVSGNGGAATAAVSGSPYTITPSAATGGTFTPGNYNITYNTNALTVNRAALSVTASAQNKTYGQTVAFGSGSTLFSSIGLQNSETIGTVTLAVSGNGGAATAAVSGSPYAITPSAATGGTFTSGNYNITYNTNALTVNRAALSVTASAQNKTYGQTVAFGSGSTLFSSIGLQNSETIGTVTLAVSGNGGTATAAVSGSPYTITPSAATGGTFTSGNYNITYNTNALTVNPLTVILTGTEIYNGTTSVAATNLSVANVIGSDNVTVASGNATLAGASVGSQAITSVGTLALGGASAGNYTLNGATGTVTITNPNTPFSITSSTLDATGTNLVVCWQSVPGVVYNVLTNASLVAPQSWAVAGSPITATDTNTCFTLPGGIVGNAATFVEIQQN